MREKRRAFEAQQVPKATIKFARWKARQWESAVDVWSDKLYWTHSETGEVRWTEPTTKEYLPADFVMPPEFEGMTDEEYDRLPVDASQGFEEVLVPYPWVDEDTPRLEPEDEKDDGGRLIRLRDVDSDAEEGSSPSPRSDSGSGSGSDGDSDSDSGSDSGSGSGSGSEEEDSEADSSEDALVPQPESRWVRGSAWSDTVLHSDCRGRACCCYPLPPLLSLFPPVRRKPWSSRTSCRSSP